MFDGLFSTMGPVGSAALLFAFVAFVTIVVAIARSMKTPSKFSEAQDPIVRHSFERLSRV